MEPERGEPGQASTFVAEPCEDIYISDVEVVSEEETDNEGLRSSLARKVARRDGRALSQADWQQSVADSFKHQRSFEDLGNFLLDRVSWLDSPLGDFIRTHCHAVQPPPTASVPYPRKGDLLPIHPSCIEVGKHGVTRNNVDWMKLTVTVLNYHYCAAWTGKPICVPMDVNLTHNQRAAIRELTDAINENILSADLMPSLADAKSSLQSKKYDYSGNPVEYMQDLTAAKVIPTWPKVGDAAIRNIADFLTGEAKEALTDPHKWVLPYDKQPDRTKKSVVRASDTEWEKICEAGFKRGMFCYVNDADVPKDKAGFLVVNGAGGVHKAKQIGNKVVDCQRFISILIPSNEILEELPGEQDSLPYIGQLTALHLGEGQELYLESEDFQSAFNLFRVPEVWCPFFAYSKKVHGRAFGKPDLGMVRPALRVVPMGWKSAVTLVQAAVRNIVYDRVGVPRSTAVQKNKEIPQGNFLSVVYLDNYDEIQIFDRLHKDISKTGEAPTETHRRFNEICDDLGLPRNEAKQLIGAFSGPMQGGEFDGVKGTLKLGREKLQNFISITMALLSLPQVSEFQIRHWLGKAAFACTFRRPLFSVLQEVFGLIEQCKRQKQSLSKEVIDEVVCFAVLVVHAQSELRAQVSKTISCTDASPTGGGSAVAEKFKTKSLVLPEEIEPQPCCGHCRKSFTSRGEGVKLYMCPRKCGERFCSARCVADHSDEGCLRAGYFAPRFGERFSGPNYPLTKACGLAGISIQRPLDKLIKDDSWNILTDQGKTRLEKMVCDKALKAEHWAPECRTFSRARGRWIQLPDGSWIEGPKQVRSSEEPWGFQHLRPSDDVAVRQGNQYMKRSISGVRTRKQAGGIGTMEHPYNSYAWDTEEIDALMQTGEWFQTVYSHCCFGGQRVKWTCLFHNSPYLHRALHKPECEGHPNLLPYNVEFTRAGTLAFDTSLEAEYPWPFCVAYANALKAHLVDLTPEPYGVLPRSLEALVYTQVRGATRGLQDEAHVSRIVQAVVHCLKGMDEGQEAAHLEALMRQVGLRGTDIRLSIPSDETDRETVAPYPAFRWLWKTVMAYKWSHEQHINVLEVTAVLTEFRRRLRHPGAMRHRFFNVVDSMVTYFALTKGRSSSKRLNRALRRIMALNIASKSVMMTLWTLSKWNFADAASRRFDAPKPHGS